MMFSATIWKKPLSRVMLIVSKEKLNRFKWWTALCKIVIINAASASMELVKG